MRAIRITGGESTRDRAWRLAHVALASWRGGSEQHQFATHEDLVEFFVCGFMTAADDWCNTPAPMEKR